MCYFFPFFWIPAIPTFIIVKFRLSAAVWKQIQINLPKRFIPILLPYPALKKFALIEECASALHELSPNQLEDFSEVLNGLITMDQQIDLFEWSMEKVIFHHLSLKRIRTPTDHYRFIKLLLIAPVF